MRIWNPFRHKPAPGTVIVNTAPAAGKRDWQLWAILLAAPTICALLIWQLTTLQPQTWCGVAIGAQRQIAAATEGAALRPEDCGTLLLKLLDIKNITIIGLLAALGVSYLLLVTDRVGGKVHIQGPNGMGIDLAGNGPDGSGTPPVSSTTVQQVVVNPTSEPTPPAPSADEGTAPAAE